MLMNNNGVLLLADEARCSKIPVAAVRQKGYNRFAGVFRTVSQLCSSIECCAAGNADEEAFLFGEFLCRFIGLFRCNGKYFVVDFSI